MGWYLVITEEMRNLALTGTDLLVFAVVHGYSQKGQGCYHGSVAYLANICGVSPNTARTSLQRLVRECYLERSASVVNGVQVVSYKVSKDTLQKLEGVLQKLEGGTPKIGGNNKIDNKVGDINISSLSNKKGGFVKPSFFEVQQYIAQRGSAVDAEAFYAYYESNGWKVGRNPMRDWKQAIVTWERREAQHPSPTPPRKESWAERQRRNLEKISAMYAGEGDVQ